MLPEEHNDVSDQTAPTTIPEGMSERLHAQLHWDAIRTVCRNRTLKREARREKLRFFVDGLNRSRHIVAML